LWAIDSANKFNDKKDPLYIDLNHYLSSAPSLDAIIITRSWRAQKISS